MTHDEELGRRALRPVVDRFVRANVGKVIPRQKSQLLSNGSCHKDKHSLIPYFPESRILGNFAKSILGGWIAAEGRVGLGQLRPSHSFDFMEPANQGCQR